MRPHYLLFLLSIFLPLQAKAQSQASAPFQIYGGLSTLSNSFNGVPGSRQPLIGWDAAVAFPAWHNLRFKIDVSDYDGKNLGATQSAYFIMAGGQYEKKWRRERFFAQALVGDGGLNRNWGAEGALGGTASFSTLLGGGVDTPVSKHFAIRFEGGFQHTTFALIQSEKNPVPYRIPGLPTYFGRFSAGLVWIPRLKPPSEAAAEESTSAKTTPESELAFEGLNSFGHYHVFAYTWWSYLHVGGVEYDRHSWGRFIGARMDYVAEILPIAILQQPSKTDVFGDPLSTAHTTVAGLGITPIGLRMMWRDEKRWKPYYTIKCGMIGFTQKALSYAASYQNFSLQQSVGIQFRLADCWDFRAGVADFHFSNAFMVPNDPGIDEMAYTGALVYNLKGRSKRF
jgi:hypothetical protein